MKGPVSTPRNLAASALLALAVLSLPACAGEDVIVRERAPLVRPVVQEEVIVRERPPVDRVEVIGVAPHAGDTWIRGHWIHEAGWRWEPGHWEHPPRERAVWMEGHWRENARGGWVWAPGHWRDVG